MALNSDGVGALRSVVTVVVKRCPPTFKWTWDHVKQGHYEVVVAATTSHPSGRMARTDMAVIRRSCLIAMGPWALTRLLIVAQHLVNSLLLQGKLLHLIL